MKTLKNLTLEQFKWFWNSASRDRILEQYYFDYRKGREWANRINKAIEFIKYSTPYWEEWHYDGTDIDIEGDFKHILTILQGSDDNE